MDRNSLQLIINNDKALQDLDRYFKDSGELNLICDKIGRERDTDNREQLISKMPKIGDAIGYCYQQEGHMFYVLNFLTAEKTFVYDLITGLWHQRAYYDESSNVLRAHRGQNGATAFDTTLVGDHSLPIIYEFSLDEYTDNGAKIIRRRRFPHTADQQKNVFYHSLEVEMEKGTADILVQGLGSLTLAIDESFETYPEGVFDSSSSDVWNVNKVNSGSGNLYIVEI